MKSTGLSGRQRLEDVSDDSDELEVFLKKSKRNQNPMDSPSTRGLHPGTNHNSRLVPDRALKPSCKTEGMSRSAAISMLYEGYPGYYIGEEINRSNKSAPAHAGDSRMKGKFDGIPQFREKDIQSPLVQSEVKKLNKKLPLPPAPPHREGGLKWQKEQNVIAARRTIDPDQTAFLNYSYAGYRSADQPMTGIPRLIADRDSDFAGNCSKELGPENPFDDYYVISRTDERRLTQVYGAILPNPSLERLEKERQRNAMGYRR